jgi:hypothetical protein
MGFWTQVISWVIASICEIVVLDEMGTIYLMK